MVDPANSVQRWPWLVPVMQITLTAMAVCVASAAIVYTVTAASEKRNADLVRIGVEVLRVDPKKETQVAAAREWALDLIDANAGGVTFSVDARESLLLSPLLTTGGPAPGFGNRVGGPGAEIIQQIMAAKAVHQPTMVVSMIAQIACLEIRRRIKKAQKIAPAAPPLTAAVRSPARASLRSSRAAPGRGRWDGDGHAPS